MVMSTRKKGATSYRIDIPFLGWNQHVVHSFAPRMQCRLCSQSVPNLGNHITLFFCLSGQL
jgi:hypothetical protein